MKVVADGQERYYGHGIGQRTGRTVRKTDLRYLYFPINVGGNHWIAMCIDFEDRLVSYGECSWL